ncbi:hypothetical protein F2Q69_00061759 [Brassica cretica]|uniref:Uncharacterized protein n=1 Tax=Brassica cretica TaxID=69181 RepID=A0A8S9RDS5_BRACR|nr:hypothetical protein F2Q69_00061759 [Brassica cretica]
MNDDDFTHRHIKRQLTSSSRRCARARFVHGYNSRRSSLQASSSLSSPLNRNHRATAKLNPSFIHRQHLAGAQFSRRGFRRGKLSAVLSASAVGIQIRRREARELLHGVVLSDRSFLLHGTVTGSPRRQAPDASGESSCSPMEVSSLFSKPVPGLLILYKTDPAFGMCKNALANQTQSFQCAI